MFAIDGIQRKKLNLLHFLIFFGWSILILLFVLLPWFQDQFGQVFGVARGSDVIVYGTLIFLWYFYFELVHELTKQKSQTSRLVSAVAIREAVIPTLANPTTQKDDFIFAMRAYNEWETIASVIDDIMSAWFSKIVIVDDGSSDDTVDIVQQKQQQYSNKTIIFLSHIINRGGWAANKTGFAFLRKYHHQLHVKWFVTYDADAQMNIADMETFIAEINNPANATTKVFLGTRFRNGGSAANIPTARKIILRGAKIVTRLLNRLSVSDPHNGYRVLHTSVLPLLRITSDGMAYASELLDSIRINHIPFVEVPVHIEYTEYSLGKWQKNRNALKILGELIYKKLFFK
jgi:polyprenyl-phospho-N-acetylgalactosaminyl synthase